MITDQKMDFKQMRTSKRKIVCRRQNRAHLLCSSFIETFGEEEKRKEVYDIQVGSNSDYSFSQWFLLFSIMFFFDFGLFVVTNMYD